MTSTDSFVCAKFPALTLIDNERNTHTYIHMRNNNNVFVMSLVLAAILIVA